MKKSKLKLKLYEIAAKFRLIFYIIAALIVFIPVTITLVTDNTFSAFYSKVFLSTAIAFIIIGRILTAFKKTVENGVIPWGIIGSIIGLLIILVQNVIS